MCVCMCVCVCMCMCVCVCVCVCVWISIRLFFQMLSSSTISLLFVLLGKQGIQVLHLISLVEVSFIQQKVFDLLPAVFAMVTGCV